MRISTSMIFDSGGAKVQRATADLLKIQQQLASGKRDPDPISAARVLQLTQTESNNTQYRRNQDTAENALRLMDFSLGSVIQTLQDVRDTTLQGINDTMSGPDRQVIVTKLRGQLDSLVAQSNAKDSTGAFLFAGFQSATQPFSGDSSTPVTYVGDNGQIGMQVSATDQIPISFSGQEVFMDIPATGGGKQSVFATINTLITQIEAGGPNLANTVADSLSNLDAGLNNILTIQSKTGSYLNQLESYRNFSESSSIENQRAMSVLQDVDYAEAISNMARQQNVLDAAQKSFVKIMGLSLFSRL